MSSDLSFTLHCPASRLSGNEKLSCSHTLWCFNVILLLRQVYACNVLMKLYMLSVIRYLHVLRKRSGLCLMILLLKLAIYSIYMILFQTWNEWLSFICRDHCSLSHFLIRRLDDYNFELMSKSLLVSFKSEQWCTGEEETLCSTSGG